jgi:hypothetical protein
MSLFRGRGRARGSTEQAPNGSTPGGPGRAGRRRRRGRVALALVVLVAGGLTLTGAAFGSGNLVQNLLAGIPNGQGGFGQSEFNDPGLGDLPIDPEWLTNTVSRATTLTSVKNNTIPGAIAARDTAVAQWKAAESAYEAGTGPQPSPLAKPEYLLVWSAKQNAADVYGAEVGDFLNQLTVNPQGLLDMLNPQFLPGLDGWQVIDARKYNVDGTPNPNYGVVVNFVQLPLPWGVETEAHHMQYQWEDGQPIIAGGLFNSATFVLNPSDIPNLTLTNIIPLTQVLGGSIPDAYDAVGNGDFIGTYMGGPEPNFGGSPGEVVVFKPDPVKGLVVASQTPAGNVGGIVTGNANGVPEPCDVREAEPLGTCANPHGIEIRQDLDRMVTDDYAEPREIVLDPIKPIDKYAFRPTVRIWDTTDPIHPKLISVAHMPNGPLEPAQRAHENYGIMEGGKTWPDATQYVGGLESKGMFAESMCGGGIFFAPDVTKLYGDSSSSWKEIWNDGISALAAGGQQGEFEDDPGGCSGGAWVQVAPNNRILFHTVQGRNPGSDNYFDAGEQKMVYDIDISSLIKDAQSGNVTCDIARGFDWNGQHYTGMQAFVDLEKGETIADCPRLISTLIVNDPTTGGPHWAEIDNHSIDQNGVPWRLAFQDYFVSRTGVDGNHRLYMVNVAPDGTLSYDQDWRDQYTGALGIDFNRRDWPGSPDAGFYKPHSALWVCPPGICPNNLPPSIRGTTATTAAPATTKAACVARNTVTVNLSSAAGATAEKGEAWLDGKRISVTRGANGQLYAVLPLSKASPTTTSVRVRFQVLTGTSTAVSINRTYQLCAAATTKAKTKARTKAKAAAVKVVKE